MGERPLRQYYDGVTVVVDDDLGSLVEPWLRHRRRLTDELSGLTEAQWKAPTRCSSWDARGVVSHLVTVDSFFTMVLNAAHAGDPPTSFIRGFDPSTGTDDARGAVARAADRNAPRAVRRRDRDAARDGRVARRRRLAGAGRSAVRAHAGPADPGPRTLGFVAARTRHPRAARPRARGRGTTSCSSATWYTLVVGGLQGGLLDDDAPVGPGADAPIDVTLGFDDLPVLPARADRHRYAHLAVGRHECSQLQVRRSSWSRGSPDVRR